MRWVMHVLLVTAVNTCSCMVAFLASPQAQEAITSPSTEVLARMKSLEDNMTNIQEILVS